MGIGKVTRLSDLGTAAVHKLQREFSRCQMILSKNIIADTVSQDESRALVRTLRKSRSLSGN
jgi:hypothetical protein